MLSETIAAGQRATLLTFVLPACTPAGPDRRAAAGWSIALAVCVPAALFLLPPRHHDELRTARGAVCVTALADRLEGKATRTDVRVTAMNALRANFLGADFRPVGLTAGSRALVRVVDDLEWLSDRVTDDTGAALRGHAGPRHPGAAEFGRGASADHGRPIARTSAARSGRRARPSCGRSREAAIARTSTEMLGEPDDAAAVAVGRALLNRRTIAATIGATGRVIAAAAAADARPVWARALGLRLPDDRERTG